MRTVHLYTIDDDLNNELDQDALDHRDVYEGEPITDGMPVAELLRMLDASVTRSRAARGESRQEAAQRAHRAEVDRLNAEWRTGHPER